MTSSKSNAAAVKANPAKDPKKRPSSKKTGAASVRVIQARDTLRPTPATPHLSIPKFLLGQKVRMNVTKRTGVVAGICTYLNGTTQFMVEYATTTGSVCSDWFYAERLSRA